MKLKIGDTVLWRGGWAKDEPRQATIVFIEKDCIGKYGTEVSEVEWSEVYDENVIVILDNGHWAYAYQISDPNRDSALNDEAQSEGRGNAKLV